MDYQKQMKDMDDIQHKDDYYISKEVTKANKTEKNIYI